MSEASAAGTVYLVGAGPGDPELLTLRGLRALQEAEVVVYDRLVHPRLLEHARPGAEQVFAGKSPGGHVMSQEEINALLIDRARTGKTVCRLKGGDPFLFGRGGEEAAALTEAGIPFVVVPGVTSAFAVPAYAGIPVTSRGVASTLAILTGHEGATRAEGPPAWAEVAARVDTAVFLMAVETLPEITRVLQEQGRAPETPAAVIRAGTLPEQETLVGTLETIAALAQERHLALPAILVVGEVVRFRERLRWFERRPIFGRRVVLTRAREQAGELAADLEALGAEVIPFPVIRIEPIPSPELEALNRPYDWMVFTSANAVRCLTAALAAAGRDLRALPRAKIAAIGEATAAALRAAGLHVDTVPANGTAEGLVEEFGPSVAGRRFLLLRAREGRDLLPQALREGGAAVDLLPLYETVRDGEGADAVRARFAAGEVDALLFTSASTVRHFLALLPGVSLEGVRVVCIGPVTAAAARASGLPVAAVAPVQSARSLAATLVAALQE